MLQMFDFGTIECRNHKTTAQNLQTINKNVVIFHNLRQDCILTQRLGRQNLVELSSAKVLFASEFIDSFVSAAKGEHGCQQLIIRRFKDKSPESGCVIVARELRIAACISRTHFST